MIRGLYAIIDNTVRPGLEHAGLAALCLRGGCRLLQLRMKGAGLDAVERAARGIMALKKDFAFTFIVNDHPEIAAAVGADGVHLGQGDMPVARARQILGPDKLIGKSNHSLEEVRTSLKEGADYLALGAIFPTQAKGPDHPIVGLDLLRQIVAISPKPVVAIGGINRGNVSSVIGTEAASFAVMSGLVSRGPKALTDEGIVREVIFYSAL